MNDAIGTLRQVGSNCLQDYTGLRSPQALAEMAEVLYSLDDICSAAEDHEGGFGPRGESLYSVETFLTYVACSIRLTGWLSRGAARARDDGSQATADHAMSCGLRPDRNLPASARLHPEQVDFDLAKATVEFLDEAFEGRDNLSDYEHNLKVTTSSGYFSGKYLGIVASAISFYKKDLERRARSASWAEVAAASKHVGVVGARALFTDMVLTRDFSYETQFGVVFGYQFVSAEKNVVVVKVSRSIPGVVIGQSYDFSGFVKAHDVYRNPRNPELPACNQTLVNRVKLVAASKVVEVKKVVEVDGKSYWHHICQADETAPRYVVVAKSRSKAAVVGADINLEPGECRVADGIAAGFCKAEEA